MRAALAALPGVRHIDVDFDSKRAVVTAAEALDSQRLVAALADAGFGGAVKDVRRIDAEPPDGSESQGAEETPPRPGLAADDRPTGAAKTTYSSALFAKHVQVSAHLDHDVLRPGDGFRIAVVFDIDDGWHIYGNPLGPGIGKETVIVARGPEGFDFEPARYTASVRAAQEFGAAGKTWVWENSGRTVHFLPGKLNDHLAPGMYRLTVEASAQVCTEGGCLPGRATIQVPVTVVAADVASQRSNSEQFKGFDQARTP